MRTHGPTNPDSSWHGTRTRRGGFTLVEAILSMLIVGVVGVAALTAATQAIKTRRTLDDRRSGRDLARLMFEEVMSKRFEEPEEAALDPSRLGPDESEDPRLDRSRLDDIDDYNEYENEPGVGLMDAQGALIEGTQGWAVRVDVSYVEPVNFERRTYDDLVSRGLPLDVKRVLVTVKRNGQEVASQNGLATRGWNELTSFSIVPADSGATP
jgi:type II secretory pathway pseudopilin PulG